MGRSRGGLLGLVADSGKSVATLSLLNPEQFQMAVGDGFRRRGFDVERHAGAKDRAVDLVLRKGGMRHLVRCEQWRAQSIGIDVIRDLSAAMAGEGACGGFVVSSGRFSREARELARASGIELYDERSLDELVPRG